MGKGIPGEETASAKSREKKTGACRKSDRRLACGTVPRALALAKSAKLPGGVGGEVPEVMESHA